MGVARVNIDSIEQVFLHIVAVRILIFGTKTDVLVEVERRDLGEI